MLAEVKALLDQVRDFLRPVVEAVLQELLEAEMTETLVQSPTKSAGDSDLKPATTRVVSRRWWKFGGAGPRAWCLASGGEVKVGG
jgi:hypothetical protein